MIFQPKTWFIIDVGLIAFSLVTFITTGGFFSLAIAALCGWCAWDDYKRWKNL